MMTALLRTRSAGFVASDARVGLADGRSGLAIHGQVRDLFDKACPTAIAFSVFETSYAGATIGDPRNYGVTVSALF